MQISKEQWINWGKQVINTEANSIKNLIPALNDNFTAACQLILQTTGKIIVTGIGKSGHIGNKIAATLASTGTPAFFVHPAEASHGDLGMITDNDLVIAISNSGYTEELLALIPLFKRLNVPIIGLTSDLNSPLAQLSTNAIHINIEKEACALGLTPTASTTATLAMGDALAMCVLQARGFTREDFAMSHPGGKLGKKLLTKVADIMRTGNDIPKVIATAFLPDAILETSNKCLGMTTIVAANDPTKVIGIFTDGDLRRVLKNNLNLYNIPIIDIMTKNFKSIDQDMLAIDALKIMKTNKILALPVIDNSERLVGAFNMQSLLQAGII